MFTYGFYNSKDHDRVYDAVEVSSIFDGIIRDGIFMSIGSHFQVTANGNNMMVTVGTGRAWFNHSWSLNDSPMPLLLPPSEIIMNRIDVIVLEINSNVNYRRNRIFVLKGTPSVNAPSKPVLADTEELHQYPLAYITVNANVTKITQANIENAIGLEKVPFVTGILETINIDSLIAQWGAQWSDWSKDKIDEYKKWTKELHDILDGEVASNLAVRILALEQMSKYSASVPSVKDTLVLRDSNKHVYLSYINSDTQKNENPAIGQFIVENQSGDGFFRKASVGYVKTILGIEELKNSVSNGKTLVANAITAKGIPTAATADFATMANNIAALSSEGFNMDGILINADSMNVSQEFDLTGPAYPAGTHIELYLIVVREGVAGAKPGVVSISGSLTLASIPITRPLGNDGYTGPWQYSGQHEIVSSGNPFNLHITSTTGSSNSSQWATVAICLYKAKS